MATIDLECAAALRSLVRSLTARFAQPEEIAKAALFLACSDSSYVFGHELVADGGWVAV